MRRLLCCTLLLVAVALPAFAATDAGSTIATAVNLEHDAVQARRQHAPILVVFTRPDCRYCDRVIHFYLEPIQRDPATAARVIIRRLDITRDTPLRDFQGRVTTARAFATTQGVHFAPTVVVYLADGTRAGKPLVGLGPEDYYGGYLDAAIDAGRQRMEAGARRR